MLLKALLNKTKKGLRGRIKDRCISVLYSMRSMWASFAAWLRLQHAADPPVSNKDVSVNPPSSSNSQETRKGRKNHAVTNCSGSPCWTGFFPMPRTVHTRITCCSLKPGIHDTSDEWIIFTHAAAGNVLRCLTSPCSSRCSSHR